METYITDPHLWETYMHGWCRIVVQMMLSRNAVLCANRTFTEHDALKVSKAVCLYQCIPNAYHTMQRQDVELCMIAPEILEKVNELITQYQRFDATLLRDVIESRIIRKLSTLLSEYDTTKMTSSHILAKCQLACWAGQVIRSSPKRSNQHKLKLLQIMAAS